MRIAAAVWTGNLMEDIHNWLHMQPAVQDKLLSSEGNNEVWVYMEKCEGFRLCLDQSASAIEETGTTSGNVAGAVSTQMSWWEYL